MNQKPSNFSSRLAEVLHELHITQTKLAERIGVRKQAIQYLCANDDCRSKFAYEIAEALGVSIDWLMRGKGSKFLSDDQHPLYARQQPLPLLTWQQISPWMNHKLTSKQISEWIMADQKYSELSFATVLQDNSLLPQFPVGTQILIDPVMPIPNNHIALVSINNNMKMLLGKLVKHDDQFQLSVVNESEQIPLITLAEKDRILGTVVETRCQLLRPDVTQDN